MHLMIKRWNKIHSIKCVLQKIHFTTYELTKIYQNQYKQKRDNEGRVALSNQKYHTHNTCNQVPPIGPYSNKVSSLLSYKILQHKH